MWPWRPRNIAASRTGRRLLQKRKVLLHGIHNILFSSGWCILFFWALDNNIFIGLVEPRDGVSRTMILADLGCFDPVKVRLELVVGPRHQHVANIHHNIASLRFDWVPCITHGKVGVCIAAGAYLKSMITRSLEQQSETVKISMCACPPLIFGEVLAGDLGLMEQTQSRLSILLFDHVGPGKKVGVKTEAFCETSQNLHTQRLCLFDKLLNGFDEFGPYIVWPRPVDIFFMQLKLQGLLEVLCTRRRSHLGFIFIATVQEFLEWQLLLHFGGQFKKMLRRLKRFFEVSDCRRRLVAKYEKACTNGSRVQLALDFFTTGIKVMETNSGNFDRHFFKVKLLEYLLDNYSNQSWFDGKTLNLYVCSN